MLPLPDELKTLLEPYQIDPAEICWDSIIGQGSFGDVYKVVIDSKVYAAKKLAPFEIEDDWFYFLREIATAASVTHPAVLRLVGFVSDPDNPVIVSDYAKHGTLDGVRQHIEEEGSLPVGLEPWRFARIFYGVASALASVHHVGVLHRDVKPENIFLSASWEPLLGDFGCARFREQRIQADHPSFTRKIGTPLFQAPELLEGENYDHKVDVYAFGMTLMVLLAPESDLRQIELETDEGPLKCTAETQCKFLRKISEGARYKQPESVPDHYWRIVEACMRPNPAERPEFTEVMAMMEDRAFTSQLEKRDLHEYLKYVTDLKKNVARCSKIQ